VRALILAAVLFAAPAFAEDAPLPGADPTEVVKDLSDQVAGLVKEVVVLRSQLRQTQAALVAARRTDPPTQGK
jgi:hypothetical protein